MKCISRSDAETVALGMRLGEQLPPNSVICFRGDLGAGKTTFIKGVVAGATGIPCEQVNSPTFVYLNIYEGTKNVYHFDLYRLRDADEFLSMGFEEMFFSGGLCCIEWSERIIPLLPPNRIDVVMTHVSENVRSIEIENTEFRIQNSE